LKILDYFVLFLLIALAMYISSCTTEDRELCTKGETSPGVVCIEIFQPVIAPDGTQYPNSCYAEKDGWDNSCLKLKNIYYG
jgi:hypothetical protein